MMVAVQVDSGVEMLLLVKVSDVYAHRQGNALVNHCYDLVLDNCGVLTIVSCRSSIQSFFSGK